MTRDTTLRRPTRHLLPATVLLSVVALVSVAAPAGATSATPTLTNQASSSGWPVGVAIYDTVTLGLGADPTGTLTFSLYGPLDPTCSGTALFTSVKPVNGNGFYASASYVTTVAGTYRWTAAYSGDAHNAPAGPTACGLASAAVVVVPRTPTVSNAASPVSPAGSVTTTATLNGANPTGTLTFRLYGPNNLVCGGTPAYTSTVEVSGNGTYTSGAFTPSAAGTYQWQVLYSGDGNNRAAGTICADPGGAVVLLATSLPIPGAPPAVTVSATPAAVARGGQITVTWSGIATPVQNDWLGVYPVGRADWFPVTWALTFGTASGRATLTIPGGAPPGEYHVRLFAELTFDRLATSAPITVY